MASANPIKYEKTSSRGCTSSKAAKTSPTGAAALFFQVVSIISKGFLCCRIKFCRGKISHTYGGMDSRPKKAAPFPEESRPVSHLAVFCGYYTTIRHQAQPKAPSFPVGFLGKGPVLRAIPKVFSLLTSFFPWTNGKFLQLPPAAKGRHKIKTTSKRVVRTDPWKGY